MWEFWRGRLDSSGRSSPRGNVSSLGLSERRSLPPVNFKDLNLSVDDELDSDDAEGGGYPYVDEDPTNKSAIIRTRSLGKPGAVKNKLIIIMVGLPGRGKTFLCNKLKCYLNWLGHDTKHFNVGNYRRMQKGADEVQDASFFDSHNLHGLEARSRALQAALDDVLCYLASESGQVAIFDATNTTVERRKHLIHTFHGKYQYMFIESICNDHAVLEHNYKYKMKFSPDYQGVNIQAALDDFKERIRKYDEVYEPINDRSLHYIKLIDMVTGRGYMDVNRISGYIPGKIVFFLMQVCKAGMTAGASRKIWLTRHGESEWNRLGKIGGDSNLTDQGEEYARMLPELLDARLPATFDEHGVPVSVWTSTLKRTIATANYLPYPKLRWKALDEIHAGVCDGMTYAEINSKFPEDYEARKTDKLRYRYPSGESYLDVIQRLEPVIIEMEREREYVLVVGHQAILRAIYGYFMAVPLKDIPTLDMPLHTLIELQPRPDGTMEVSQVAAPLSPRPGHSGSGGGSSSSSSQHQAVINLPQHQLPVQVPFGSSPLQALHEQQMLLQQQSPAGAHRRCGCVASQTLKDTQGGSVSTSAIGQIQQQQQQQGPELRAIQTRVNGTALPGLQQQLDSSIGLSSGASPAELAAGSHHGLGSAANSVVSMASLADGVAGPAAAPVPSPFSGYVDVSSGATGPACRRTPSTQGSLSERAGSLQSRSSSLTLAPHVGKQQFTGGQQQQEQQQEQQQQQPRPQGAGAGARDSSTQPLI